MIKTDIGNKPLYELSEIVTRKEFLDEKNRGRIIEFLSGEKFIFEGIGSKIGDCNNRNVICKDLNGNLYVFNISLLDLKVDWYDVMRYSNPDNYEYFINIKGRENL